MACCNFRAAGRTVVFVAMCVSATCAARAADPQRLTQDGRIKFSPVFIDREQLVFVVLSRPELFELRSMHFPTHEEESLFGEQRAPQLEPAFSPDGRYAAFVHTKGALSLALIIRDRQSNQDVELPPPPGFAGYRSPTFSADGKRVVYSLAEGGKQSLYTTTLDGKQRQQLTTSRGINNWPCVSPDGKQILFGSTRDGNFEIYVMSSAGKNVRRLTRNPYQDLRPRFSPDGKRIIFTSNRDGNYEIYVMGSDGSGVRRVTNHPERDDYPTWHPNGRQVVAVSERSGRHDLYLITLAN